MVAVEQTWTFVGHWDNDRIVVEYVLPGDVQDERIDTGYWEQGLWAASGTGTDLETTQAAVIAEYEQDAQPGKVEWVRIPPRLRHDPTDE